MSTQTHQKHALARVLISCCCHPQGSPLVRDTFLLLFAPSLLHERPKCVQKANKHSKKSEQNSDLPCSKAKENVAWKQPYQPKATHKKNRNANDTTCSHRMEHFSRSRCWVRSRTETPGRVFGCCVATLAATRVTVGDKYEITLSFRCLFLHAKSEPRVLRVHLRLRGPFRSVFAAGMAQCVVRDTRDQFRKVHS